MLFRSTDPAYAEAARRRIAGERRQVQVAVRAGDGRATDPFVGGWAAKDLAIAMLGEAGFTEVHDDRKVVTGVEPSLSAIDRRGRRWWFEVVGGRTSNRPGAHRIELLWRAIAKGAVAHEADPQARFGVLSVGLPTAATGGAALAAVTGPKGPVHVVVDLLDDDAIEQLRRVAR